MTVTESRAVSPRRRRPLPDVLGWAFVSAVALVALLGIAGERLGIAEALVNRVPPGSPWPRSWPEAIPSSAMSCARCGTGA